MSFCGVGEEGSVRAECLERYREKKQRRLFCKTIRYHKRKVNADKRCAQQFTCARHSRCTH